MPLIPTPTNKAAAPPPKAAVTPEMPKIVFQSSEPKYAFRNLILADKTMDELQTVVSAQQNWHKVFVEWGLETVLKDRKSLFINLYGPSGTGKTMAAHAIASELKKKMICVNYADIESKYVGETSKNLSVLFTTPEYREHIIFFDEADALLSKRVTNMNNATDVSVNQTRSVLLTLLNSYEGMVIFATNFISNYDPAFMRRIHYHIQFELPNDELREKLFRYYIPPQMPNRVDIKALSEKSAGLSGSDISTVVLKAALSAAKKDAEAVIQDDFEVAIGSILVSKAANTPKQETVIEKSEVIPAKYVPASIREKLEGGEANDIV